MKALVLTEYKKMEYMEVEKPVIAPDEVLIQVKACGICGSDIHGFDGSTGRRQPPVIMGHEASGIITEVGSAVTGWKVSDRVTFDSTIYCGHCYYCQQGLINLCENRRVLGVSCDEYRKDGAFAEYVAVPQHILYKLPDEVTYNQATIVEPLSIAFHAVNLSPRTIDASVVVVGAGMVGLLVVQTLRAAGYGKIIAIDVDESRLALAKEMGADITLISDEKAPEAVKKLTGGQGSDIVIEVVGANASFNTAVNCVRKGGAVTLVGNISAKVDLPLQAVVTRQIRLQGSCASSGEYPACLDMIARKQVDVDTIISETAPLSEGNKWFTKLYNRDGNYLKVVLNP
ncbi:MAG: zinc-binding dehydrogenase [Flexilinea sp.]